MANKPHYPLLVRQEASRGIWGSWICNNASNPDASTIEGEGIKAVTKTANAGEFEVELDDDYFAVGPAIGFKSRDDVEPAASCTFHFPNASTLTSTRKFLIEYQQNGVGTNRVSGDNVRIGFFILALNRKLGL